MLKFCLPWPYAHATIIQHNWAAPFISVWITFEPRMDQTVKPAHNLWVLKLDGIPIDVIVSSWVDQHTLVIGAGPVLVLPGTVHLAFSGPDENLRTNYNKQWEPWGDQLSIRIPYLWEDILIVDPPNKRVTIAGQFVQSTLTHSAAGPVDDLDVSLVNVVFVDCSSNAVTIGGLKGGVNGQVLHIAKTCAADNDVTLEHNEGGGDQDLFLHAGGDETLKGEYGGWTLVCNGSGWYDISHSKHV